MTHSAQCTGGRSVPICTLGKLISTAEKVENLYRIYRFLTNLRNVIFLFIVNFSGVNTFFRYEKDFYAVIETFFTCLKFSIVCEVKFFTQTFCFLSEETVLISNFASSLSESRSRSFSR